MDWKTHLIAGFVLSSFFAFITRYYFTWDWKLILTAIPIIIYYSLLPDIDHPISKITGIMFIASFFFILFGFLSSKIIFFNKFFNEKLLIFGIIMFGLTIFAAFILNHRGPIHTIWASLLSPLLLLIVFDWNIKLFILFLIAAVAFWSHLLMDGIPFKMSCDS